MENDMDSKFVLKFSNLLHYNKKSWWIYSIHSGRCRSFKVTDFGISQKPVGFLLVNNTKLYTISNRFKLFQIIGQIQLSTGGACV